MIDSVFVLEEDNGEDQHGEIYLFKSVEGAINHLLNHDGFVSLFIETGQIENYPDVISLMLEWCVVYNKCTTTFFEKYFIHQEEVGD